MFFCSTARQKKDREAKTLTKFINIFCRQIHHCGLLCPECSDLLAYAKNRLSHCPYDPKPKCKYCKTHCYAPRYRAKIREVMKFSGMYMVKRGRLDWLIKYFLQVN